MSEMNSLLLTHGRTSVPKKGSQAPAWFPSSLFFFLLLFNPEGNTGRTRKGIKFWIERLIINLSRELILGVLGRS